MTRMDVMSCIWIIMSHIQDMITRTGVICCMIHVLLIALCEMCLYTFLYFIVTLCRNLAI